MKYLVSVLVLATVAFNANAANNARPAMSGKMIMAAPRYTASINQLNGGKVTTTAQPTKEETVEQEKDMREAERNACINNNIGVGNTFVWASRFSDTSSYANMVEDVEKPENNVCFVKVELKSDDESRISVNDIEPKYFIWDEVIECGSWADAKDMEKRILDARKGARIGGIVASTVGGAGLGVGAMELIGNTAIDGWKGQKELSGSALYRSNLLALKQSKKDEDINQFRTIQNHLYTIKSAYNAHKISEAEYAKYKDLIEDSEIMN